MRSRPFLRVSRELTPRALSSNHTYLKGSEFLFPWPVVAAADLTLVLETERDFQDGLDNGLSCRMRLEVNARACAL